MGRLEEMTRVSDTDWGRACAPVRRRCSAEVAEDGTRWGKTIEPLAAETRIRPQLARAHLAYGEWLRRGSRRVDARRELLRAFEMFTGMGVDAFAERARRKLAATKVRRNEPQEARGTARTRKHRSPA